MKILRWAAPAAVLAIDGVHVTLTRVALLDGFLTFFVTVGALFVWLDHERARGSAHLVSWRRPRLLAAGLAFGAAAAVKWSGLYPLAFFLVMITVWDVIRRLREGSSRPWLSFTGAIALVMKVARRIPAGIRRSAYPQLAPGFFA